MNLIFSGNYAEWIDPKWINELVSIEGYKAPREMKLEETINDYTKHHDHPEEKAMYSLYPITNHYLNIIQSNMVSFKLEPPWVEGKKYDWWVTKMMPGQFIPLHRDEPNWAVNKRYWMALTPYEKGHVFVYDDSYVTKYNVGDLYVYDNLKARHGAINLGSNLRMILQVSTF